MTKIDVIMGVRPDFIQAAALNRTFSEYEDKLDLRFIHTGQHYDLELSQIHLEQLNVNPLHAILPVEGEQGNQQLSAIMLAYEQQQLLDPPDFVLVMGNSNSALACSLITARNGIGLGHIGAGTRYENRLLIEEQNDLLIDQLATLLFPSDSESVINLIREGAENSRIVEIGNIRADSVFQNLGHVEDSNVLDRYGLESGAFITVTLHHAYLLKDIPFLISFFTLLEELSESLTIHAVLHPQTQMIIEDIPEIIQESSDNFQIVSAHNYHDMLKLIKNSAMVVTDSQGLQEETTILGVQCLTLGEFTNRPITLAKGTNTLVGRSSELLRAKIMEIVSGERKEAYPMELWDGKAGQRLAQYLLNNS
ncbi:MAG: UDP-N-acetylglucosamine 2-epimerase [Candidatus Marinimicrobia bacterium]|nr:UDP-N-acetylglucosamine 2-epimerase [Candidatus Neomarinimicrobiota bacterium]